MKIIELNTWNRKQLFEHFIGFKDPYFAVTFPLNVTKAFKFSKDNNLSFFARYMHDCMKSINNIANFKYRIKDNDIIEYDVIHSSATMLRKDRTFGFSFIEYDENLNVFINNIEDEKLRINSTNELYPPINGLDCIHCSTMPWINFTGHKEPVSGVLDSVPKIAFSKATKVNNELIMNVSVSVNHALVDGYHVGLFLEKFQHDLSQ